ncbi:hypothetical protein BDW02DRAFT_584568 [Decorospora gaudefroyi]|uniref:Uncharacterized protein n=1 Tax=Decorospora gaudefroyi TaxID=184978 RepID=A0A6A5JWI9_9PLEO|nr:hypothetical protein BDW02DRAFT_584568 [Decorospora gaudefroyi]
MERADLIACIEELVAEPDPRSDDEVEPVEAAIWAAMDGLMRFSQAPVIERVGVFPLQPYMDKEAIVKHTRPWQQVLMFFARTQKEHAWKSPHYRFRRRQRKAWEALVHEAEKAAGGEAEETDEEADEEIDEIDEEMDEEGEEQDNDDEPEIEMDERIRRQRQHPELLGADLADSQDSDEETDDMDDSAYESGPSRSPRRRPRGCLQLVQQMMDRFMVRGSHGPMQWMLDLRTYGLKIHYNTTSRWHVEWTGDELLYKELHFSMAQFRSMVHGLAGESRRLLTEELLFGKATSIPAVPWESMRDNPTDERPGWNFLKD